MNSKLLDRVAVSPLVKKNYARVFEPRYGDALVSNPRASGRFTRKKDNPLGTEAAASWYISDSEEGALWEIILRDVKPNDANGVVLDPALLVGKSFQWVECVGDVSVLRLEPLARRRLLNREDARFKWMTQAIEEEIYELTHVVAGLLWLQAKVERVDLAGLSWVSKQMGTDVVYIIYDPPFDAASWRPSGLPVDLGTPAGHSMIRKALLAQGFHWANDPRYALPLPDPHA